jgi:hypothetical protein
VYAKRYEDLYRKLDNEWITDLTARGERIRELDREIARERIESGKLEEARASWANWLPEWEWMEYYPDVKLDVKWIDTLKTELESSGFKLVDSINYRRLEWVAKEDGTRYYKEWQSVVIDYFGRKIILVEINWVNMPFYLSTWNGWKANVPAGKWYPAFGVKWWWINKLHGTDLVNYYWNARLRQVSEILDNTIWDIRNNSTIPKVSQEWWHWEFINRDMGTPGIETQSAEVEANIRGVLTRIGD